MKDYKIGVLLSAYNGEKYITQQVQSIMKQNIASNITLLIRNDGSTDHTSQILNGLKEKYSNLIVMEGKNIGLIASFFKLLETAVKEYDFDYYSFSDQDDYWLKDKLETAVSYLSASAQNKPLLYGCRSMIVDENLKPTGFMTQAKEKNITFYNTAIQNIVIGHNQVLNKKLAQILLKQKPDFKRIYSQDLWITNVAAVTGSIIFDNTPHTYYRMHGDNQLGYGKGTIDRIYSHIVRLRKKESHKMALQLNYFCKCLNTFLSNDEKREMLLFFSSQYSLRRRYRYIRSSQLYRQNPKETRLFKILYLLKQYNV